MAKQILDHLLTIASVEDGSEQQSYAKGLYLTNRLYAKYCDLCYDRTTFSRFGKKRIPEHKTDNVPYGYHLSCLERTFDEFRASAFKVKGEENRLSYDNAQKRVIQILESVSDVEADFLKQIMGGTVTALPFEVWKGVRNA